MSYELGSRILSSLCFFEQRGKIIVDKKHLSKLSMLFGLSDDELHSQLSALTRDHLLEKVPSSGNRTIFKLTDLGNERSKVILDELGPMKLDGIAQNLPNSMDLNELISHLSDPFEKVLVLEMLIKDRTMDISKVIYLERTNPSISAEDMVLRTLDGESERSEGFFHQVFYRTTLYGKPPFEATSQLENRIEGALLLANRLLHCGDITAATAIYEGILKEKATKNQTLLSKIWLTKIEGFKGKKDESLKDMGSLINDDNSPVQNAYLNMVLGEMLVESGEAEKGLERIKGANKTFEMAGLDILEALSRTHIGVYFFRKDRFKESEFHFNKGYNAAKRCGSEYLRSYIDANMADIHIQKGELEKAKKKLDRAEAKFIEFNDLYGLAGVHFNWALYHIAKGDEDKAQESMTKALNVAFPLPNPYLRDEWKRVYEERREKNRSEKGPKAL